MSRKDDNHSSGKQFEKPSKRKLLLLNQKSVDNDNSVRKTSDIPYVPRRYSEPSGDHLKLKMQRENSTSNAEMKKSIQEEETFNEAAKSLVCEACDESFSDLLAYKLHLSSKSHRKSDTLKALKGILNIFEKKRVLPENSASVSQTYSSCLLCQKKFFEPSDYFQHLQTSSHKKRVSLQKIFNRVSVLLTDSEDEDESQEREACGGKTSVRFTSRLRCSSNTSFTTIGDDCFACSHCDKVFTGKTPFALHLASKHHEKAKRVNSLLAELQPPRRRFGR